MRSRSTHLPHLLVLALSSGLAAQVLPPPPGATVINFDTVSAPCVFLSTTPLRTAYLMQGVDFQGPSVLDGGAIVEKACGGWPMSGESPPNILGFNSGATMMNGGVPRGPETLVFNPVVSHVQINAAHSFPGMVTLECFDGTAMSLGSDSFAHTASMQTLVVTAPGIASCRITLTGPVLTMDDLAFVQGPPPPTCSLSLPASPASDVIDVDVDVSGLSGASGDVTVEYSVDGGTTWQLATMDASSPNPNPASGLPAGMATFAWDSRGDGVGVAAAAVGVVVRAAVLDPLTSETGRCSDSLDVDNTLLCGGICGDCDLGGTGPNVLDALSAARIAAGLITPSAEQAACCDVDVSGIVGILDALIIAQSAAGLSVTLTCV